MIISYLSFLKPNELPNSVVHCTMHGRRSGLRDKAVESNAPVRDQSSECWLRKPRHGHMTCLTLLGWRSCF